MGCRLCKRADVAHNARTCTNPIPGSNKTSDKMLAFANEIQDKIIIPQANRVSVMDPDTTLRWKALWLIRNEAVRLRKNGK